MTLDKLNPTFQATDLTVKAHESVSSWYTTESTFGDFTPSEFAYLQAQGWRTTKSYKIDGTTTYFLSRRIIKPEKVLNALVRSYVTAYNEGRALNDQRYDDLVTVYQAVLDSTEDAYIGLETDDDAYEVLVESILASIATDHTTYAADVEGDLDDYGDSIRDQINNRFDAELAKAQQALLDRGMYNSTIWTGVSAGIERERTLALTDVEDKITQQQLALKHKVQAELISMRSRILAARDRLRTFLREAKDRQVAARNAVVTALGQFVERRTDSYPDMAEIGRLAASLGAGSAEAYSP